jgi:ribosomal protein L25 (general stress protein Ctc)
MTTDITKKVLLDLTHNPIKRILGTVSYNFVITLNIVTKQSEVKENDLQMANFFDRSYFFIKFYVFTSLSLLRY